MSLAQRHVPCSSGERSLVQPPPCSCEGFYSTMHDSWSASSGTTWYDIAIRIWTDKTLKLSFKIKFWLQPKSWRAYIIRVTNRRHSICTGLIWWCINEIWVEEILEEKWTNLIQRNCLYACHLLYMIASKEIHRIKKLPLFRRNASMRSNLVFSIFFETPFSPFLSLSLF
jgi:hypothetical protein